MKIQRNDIIVEWAINKIEREYKDDVSLLIIYGSYENGTANPFSDVDFYFIPKTDRGYKLSKTFIVEGIGFDLFPMSWERVEGIAELNEGKTPLLANGKIIYCRDKEDKRRFKELQNRLDKNLKNNDFMLEKAHEVMENAVNSYCNMLFEDNICELRTTAGNIAMLLSDVVAYANGSYFSRGVKKQVEDLESMESVPENFVLLYKSIVNANSMEELKEYCYKLIKNTKCFMNSKIGKAKNNVKEARYKELAELYQEIISIWVKIRVCCDSGDAVLAYISGTCLQNELNIASKKHGLSKLDLMSFYDVNHLKKFNERAVQLQKEFVRIITDNGAIIEEYNTVEEFMKNDVGFSELIMKITFMGTGAATSVPLAFCKCESCKQSRILKGRNFRKRSSILINEDLLIDFGPDVMSASFMYNVDIDKVKFILQTHAHSDHFDSGHLITRDPEYAVRDVLPLVIYASDKTLKSMSQKLKKECETVELFNGAERERLNLDILAVKPFEKFKAGSYTVTAIPSNHDKSEDSLLYIVEREGIHVFYGTDTVEFPEDVWEYLVQNNFKLDIVILDHTYGFNINGDGHLNGNQFIQHMEKFKKLNLLAENAKIFANHISHEGNPSHEEMVNIAVDYGYEIAYDGLVLNITKKS